jgi:hypothetical protein
MTYLRSLTGALLALTLVALVFAIPASAAGGTTLCKVNETPCSAANHYESGTEFFFESGAMTFTTTSRLKGAETINCGHAKIQGQSSSTGSNSSSVTAVVTSIEFRECALKTLGGAVDSCENVTLNFPGAVITNTAGTMNGTFTMSVSKGELTWQVHCAFGVFCQYTTLSMTLDLIGGEEASLVANEEQLKGPGGFNCAETLDWNATLKMFPSRPIWLAQSL